MCINLLRSRTTAIYSLNQQILADHGKYISWQKKVKDFLNQTKPNPSRLRRTKSGIFSSPSAAALSADLHAVRAGALQIGNLPPFNVYLDTCQKMVSRGLWCASWWQPHLLVLQVSEHYLSVKYWSWVSRNRQWSCWGYMLAPAPAGTSCSSSPRHTGLLWQ